MTAEHERWMRRAIQLARRGEGLTRPNPPVGAVLVKRGRLVAEGWHRRAGGPHAEIVALRRAGRRARGCTLYVTLEPCSTWGRTPPCTDAVLSAGVRRVVACLRDPNPRHAGRGLRVLRARGVEVIEGVCAAEGRELLAPFAKWIVERRPFVTLKLGMSADGRLADAAGRSRWITGPASRARVQSLRRKADAVMVGAGTVRADDPSLLPRPARGRKPFRVVVAGRWGVPGGAQVLNDGHASQTIVAAPSSMPSRSAAQYERKGATIVRAGRGRRVSLRIVLRKLGRMDVLHVLCEGGGELAADLIGRRLVDELVLFVSPCIIGGRRAVPAVGGRGWSLGAKRGLVFTGVERVGRDLLIRAKLG